MSSIIGDFLSLVNNSDIGMESINQKGFVLSYQGPLFPDLNISLESICETTAANAKDLHPVYIILSHSASTMSNLIKKVTGDTYSHAALCLDPKFRTFYSFGTKEKDPKQLSELPMSYLVGQGKGYITINYRKIRENTLKAKYQYLKDIQK